MLSYDGLIARSLERGMPAGKLRGAVREYIQILALKALYAAPRAEGLAFLGGTALRFGYDLPRFSEDLDFDVRDFSFREWKLLLEETSQALSRQGLSLEMRASEKGSLLSGDMRLKGARILSAKGVAGDTQDVIASRLKFFGSAKLSVMAKRLEPFLFKPEQASLVAKAPTLLPDALEYLKGGGIF